MSDFWKMNLINKTILTRPFWIGLAILYGPGTLMWFGIMAHKYLLSGSPQ